MHYTVLQLNVTANWGSTGKIAEEIGSHAINKGWKSYIAYGREANSSRSNLIKVGNHFDVIAHYAHNILFDGEGLGSVKATTRLVSHIQEINPNIIHLHNIHDHWLNYPIFFKYLSNISVPIVWTFHDCWAFTGGCPYFEIPYCDKWMTLCGHCPLRSKRIDRSRYQFNLRRNLFASLGHRLTIVPVSYWLASYVKKSFLKSSKIEMIHNGIDCTNFRILSQKSKKPLLLGVANVWDYRKGLGDFIELRKHIPIDAIDITLVGLTDKQIKSLPYGINGISRTQNVQQLVELYNQASILINPTYADNFPTVNLEALACGTPVITYNTGGSPEAINESTGIVIEQGDITSMIDGIKTILDDSEKFTPSQCRDRAVKLFNKDIQNDKYLNLYNEILNIK